MLRDEGSSRRRRVGPVAPSASSVNFCDSLSYTALDLASRNDRLEIANVLLANGADVGIGDDSGETALHAASRTGHERIARALLDRGAILRIVSSACEESFEESLEESFSEPNRGGARSDAKPTR